MSGAAWKGATLKERDLLSWHTLRASMLHQLRAGRAVLGVSVVVEHDKAQQTVRGLVELRKGGQLVTVLDTICPYNPASDAELAIDTIGGVCYLLAVDECCRLAGIGDPRNA